MGLTRVPLTWFSDCEGLRSAPEALVVEAIELKPHALVWIRPRDQIRAKLVVFKSCWESFDSLLCKAFLLEDFSSSTSKLWSMQNTGSLELSKVLLYRKERQICISNFLNTMKTSMSLRSICSRLKPLWEQSAPWIPGLLGVRTNEDAAKHVEVVKNRRKFPGRTFKPQPSTLRVAYLDYKKWTRFAGFVLVSAIACHGGDRYSHAQILKAFYNFEKEQLILWFCGSFYLHCSDPERPSWV